MTTDGSAAAPEPSPLAPPEAVLTLTAPEAPKPVTETAAALEIRPGTVKSRTVRGLARLRVLLAEEATA